MNDSRLDQVAALADDARCLISELRDEGGSYGEIVAEKRVCQAMTLQHIQRLLNDVIRETQKLKDA